MVVVVEEEVEEEEVVEVEGVSRLDVDDDVGDMGTELEEEEEEVAAYNGR